MGQLSLVLGALFCDPGFGAGFFCAMERDGVPSGETRVRAGRRFFGLVGQHHFTDDRSNDQDVFFGGGYFDGIRNVRFWGCGVRGLGRDVLANSFFNIFGIVADHLLTN